ncbi:MAG: hypothetical protein HDR26_09145 [Lachnospiraceae bacterium]|nr:hypothetical protein [Lachnospiraceae bacterium]
MNTKGYMNGQELREETKGGIDVDENLAASAETVTEETPMEDSDDSMSDIDAMLRELNLDTRSERRVSRQEETDISDQQPEEFGEPSIEDMLENLEIKEKSGSADTQQSQADEDEGVPDVSLEEDPKERKRREKQERRQAKKNAKKAAKENRKNKDSKKAEDTESDESESGQKSAGGLKGLFDKLTEDMDEEAESKASGSRENSDDMDENFPDISAEDAKKAAEKKKKAKADQKAKAKKEKEKKAAEKKKAKAKAKPKAAKAKPAKKAAPPKAEKPGKRLKKGSVLIIGIFAASVLAMLLFVNMLLSPILEKRGAEEAFEKKDYVSCYRQLAGMKLSEEEMRVQRYAEVVLKMTRRLENYEYYKSADSELEALNSLMTAVADHDTLRAQAADCGADREVEDIYSRIVGILSERYGVSEDDAKRIVSCESDLEYTRYLAALIWGENVEDLPGIVSPKTEPESKDLLPEEQEMTNADVSD